MKLVPSFNLVSKNKKTEVQDILNSDTVSLTWKQFALFVYRALRTLRFEIKHELFWNILWRINIYSMQDHNCSL